MHTLVSMSFNDQIQSNCIFRFNPISDATQYHSIDMTSGRSVAFSLKSQPPNTRLLPSGQTAEQFSSFQDGTVQQFSTFLPCAKSRCWTWTNKTFKVPLRVALDPDHGLRKVDVRLPGKENSNSYGARPVHLIITMIKWIRTSRSSIQNSL